LCCISEREKSARIRLSMALTFGLPRRASAWLRMVNTMRRCVWVWLLGGVACGAAEQPLRDIGAASDGGGSTGGSGGAGGAGGAGGTGAIVIPPGLSDASSGTEGGIITSLPAGFTPTETGGYKLGVPLGDGTDAGGSTGGGACGNILLGVLRDFKGRNEPSGHPDFEGPLYGMNVTPNLVAPVLDPTQKPVYASMCEEGRASPPPTCPFNAQTTTKSNFDAWYRYTANVNQPYLLHMYFAPQQNGLFTFQSLFFYPLDNAGWGNSGNGKEGRPHNFSFTTELHTRFKYNGGETFQFDGDDDVWVFINNHLAVDLGGLHPRAASSVSLDASAQQLGITKGQVYALDLFHAERHTPESTFRIDTNLSFVNCGIIVK
jgi:fibro-slime domain-containing protein